MSTENTVTARPDPRRNAYRSDLAAESLRDMVSAPRYAAGRRHRVVHPATALRREPGFEARLDSEVLFGETMVVYDESDGWAWGQLERDGYVGYIVSDALSDALVTPTHRVSAIGTFLYEHPDIKSPPMMHLSINTPLAITRATPTHCTVATGGFVIARHLAPLDRPARDFVEIAERLIGTPYLWGGRTRIGIDCSGLVQVAMEAAGLACPRDSDMQQAEVGQDVLVPENLDGLLRGDLVFWPGHVGIMTDGIMLVHANAYHMAVVVEPLVDAAQRIAKTGSKIAAIKRLKAQAT
jgi:cell wall-associated NlpC family hydrolase